MSTLCTASGGPPAAPLASADSRPAFESSDTKSRSRRCHNVWHAPRSNWMRRESTGTHFTLRTGRAGKTRPEEAVAAAIMLLAAVIAKTAAPEGIEVDVDE